MNRTERVTGACSVVGGAAWALACFTHNRLPQGCIDEGCVDRVMRGSSTTATVLFIVAGLLLAATGIGLLALTGRRRGGLGASGRAAGIAGAAGLALLFAAGIVSTFVDNDWDGMPGLVVPGILLLSSGLFLLALVVFRGGILPPWLSLLLLATVALVPFANEQTSRVLLAVPFGLAWLVVGAVLLRPDPAPRPVPGSPVPPVGA